MTTEIISGSRNSSPPPKEKEEEEVEITVHRSSSGQKEEGKIYGSSGSLPKAKEEEEVEETVHRPSSGKKKKKTKISGSSRSPPKEKEEVEKIVYRSSSPSSSSSSSEKKKKKKKKKAKISGFLWSPPKEKEEEEEEEEVVSVYVGVNAYDEGVNEFGRRPEVTDCYLIKLSTKKMNEFGRVEEPLSVEPIGRKLPLPWRSSSVALGSTIYCTVNTCDGRVQVLAMDTTNINIDCKEVSVMNLGNKAYLIDAVTADDGKIYVFYDGKSYSPSFDHIFLCNVLDPTNNTRKPINHPTPSKALPSLCPEDTFALYDDSAGRILLGSLGGRDCNRGFLFSYNLEDASWKILDQALFNTSILEEHHMKIRSRPAFFDNTLYWIGVCNDLMRFSGVYAYDLDLQTPIYGNLSGIPTSFWDASSGSFQLHHFRGDLFILIWLDHQVVRCERVQISISKREGHQTSLAARVLSTQAYQLLNTYPYCQIGAVLL